MPRLPHSFKDCENEELHDSVRIKYLYENISSLNTHIQILQQKRDNLKEELHKLLTPKLQAKINTDPEINI